MRYILKYMEGEQSYHITIEKKKPHPNYFAGQKKT